MTVPNMKEPGRIESKMPYLFQQTGEDGQFKNVTYPGWNAPVYITHDLGMLSTSMDQLTNGASLVLEPWSRVEGVFRVGNQPQKNVEVSSFWIPIRFESMDVLLCYQY